MHRVLVFGALVGATLLGATFAGDGSGFGGVLPVGGAAVLLLAATFVAVGAGRLPAPAVGRSGLALVVSAVGVVVWTGVTIAWSIVPDRSWNTFDKTIAFAAFLGLGFVLATVAGRLAARTGAAVLAAVLGATLVWAVLAKAIPALDPGGDRVARLRVPVDYWNALALLADMAIVLGLWLGSARELRRGVRVAGALLVYVAALALLLTLSRAGVAVGLGAVALWLLLSRARLQSGLLLVASAGPAALVGAWAFTRPALTHDVATRSDRVADGAVFGGLALVGAGIVVGLVLLGLRRSLDDRARTRFGRGLLALAALCVAGLAVGGALSVGHAVSRGRSCDEVVNNPSRLASLDPNDRLCWWREAWDVFAGHAPQGAGAGTFEVARRRYRVDARTVSQPHSVPLQMLADGGVLGLVLFLALLGSAGAVCVCAMRRLGGPEREAAAALVVVPAVYLGHALVDYDWDFLAVTAPTMVAVGVVTAAGRELAPPRRRVGLAVGAVLLAAATLVSLSFPRVSDRLQRSSTVALVTGDFATARDRARLARVFDPLSAGPLIALARVAERENQRKLAERRYIDAVELQPDNPDTWYALGIYEFEVLRNLCAAYRFLNNAYTLDPSGDQWVKGGPLDVARAAVNAGGCAPGS